MVAWAWGGADLVTNSIYNQSEVWSDGWALDSDSNGLVVLSFHLMALLVPTLRKQELMAVQLGRLELRFHSQHHCAFGVCAGSGSIEVNGTDVGSQVTDERLVQNSGIPSLAFLRPCQQSGLQELIL